ncbi:MAG: hypothetical protein LBB38_01535 [Puniceicoccales bacterium]|jgi:hypothetical protein|nr:hypothetical protein [Puniceicoccales bacterium]
MALSFGISQQQAVQQTTKHLNGTKVGLTLIVTSAAAIGFKKDLAQPGIVVICGGCTPTKCIQIAFESPLYDSGSNECGSYTIAQYLRAQHPEAFCKMLFCALMGKSFTLSIIPNGSTTPSIFTISPPRRWMDARAVLSAYGVIGGSPLNRLLVMSISEMILGISLRAPEFWMNVWTMIFGTYCELTNVAVSQDLVRGQLGDLLHDENLANVQRIRDGADVRHDALIEIITGSNPDNGKFYMHAIGTLNCYTSGLKLPMACHTLPT